MKKELTLDMLPTLAEFGPREVREGKFDQLIVFKQALDILFDIYDSKLEGGKHMYPSGKVSTEVIEWLQNNGVRTEFRQMGKPWGDHWYFHWD